MILLKPVSALPSILIGICFVLVSCTTTLENNPREDTNPEMKGKVDGYTYCGVEEVCDGAKKRGGKIWCLNNKACTNQKNCSCNLFRRKKGQPGYKHVAGPRKKADYDNTYIYACFCVKK